jgi:hypothetical protein
MSTEDFSSDVELYGVSPGIMAFIMFVVSIVFPTGFLPDGGYLFPIAIIFAFIYPLPFLPLTILNILFAYWIVRYYQAKSSKDSVIMLGLLSILLPTIIVLYITGLSLVIYPLPVQFVSGLILLWKFDGPEVISPWSGMRLDLSWWKWQRPNRKSDWDPIPDDARVPSDEDWLKE